MVSTRAFDAQVLALASIFLRDHMCLEVWVAGTQAELDLNLPGHPPIM